ncbi:MAG: type II secretion system F family protein [Candidatus Pacebacteria bacterium]|nr:type II secretion system F family protein [Candidatus Paceibacterota bacterium]
MKYRYRARNQEGSIETGIVEAMTENNAIETLQSRGLIITGLEEAGKKKGVEKEINVLPKRVKAKDLVFFYRQFSILVTSGTPLVESLNALSMQVQNRLLKEQVMEISNDVNGGMALSEAMAKHPKTFTRFVVSMIKVGEVGGKLSSVLEYLADHQEREYTLTKTITGALYYPAVILLVCVGVLVIMLTFVMPKVSDMFKQFETDLPLPTKIILGVSGFLTRYWWLVFIIVGIAIWLLIRYIKTPQGKIKKDKLELKAPILGTIFQNMYYARLSENLATLVKGGIPIVQALETVASVMGNSFFKKALRDARDNVRKGGEISEVFKDSEVISPTLTHMVESGEKSGNLDRVLGDLATFYNGEVERAVSGLITLLEPVLLIGIALVVLFLAIAIVMPIYGLVGAIH